MAIQPSSPHGRCEIKPRSTGDFYVRRLRNQHLPHPQVFYKYASADTAHAVLASGRLRWSSPLLFNDVAEFQRMPRFEPSITDAYGILPGILLEAVRGLRAVDMNLLNPTSSGLLIGMAELVRQGTSTEEILKSLHINDPHADRKVEHGLRKHFQSLNLKRARILCVTTDPINDAMWANYAANHTGCVLTLGHIPEQSTPLLAATQVSYSDEPPLVGSGLDFLLYGDSKALRERTTHAVCFTKKSSWSYEKEWRVLAWRPEEVGKKFGDYQFLPGELLSVTIGCRASNSTLSKTRELISQNYPNSRLFKVAVHHGDLVPMEVTLPNRDA